MKKRWNFTAEVPIEIVAVVNVRGYSDPGIHTLANGDPGYPPERDEEREVTGAYFDLFIGWDGSNRRKPRRITKRLQLTGPQIEALRDILQEIVEVEEIDPAEHCCAPKPDDDRRHERRPGPEDDAGFAIANAYEGE